jgi:hypothetical protein
MTKNSDGMFIFVFNLVAGAAFGATAYSAGFGYFAAAICFGMPAAIGTWFAFGKDQFAQIYRENKEERHRDISHRSAYFTMMVAGFGALAGQLFEISQGKVGVFGLMSGLIWTTYILSVVVVAKRSWAGWLPGLPVANAAREIISFKALIPEG